MTIRRRLESTRFARHATIALPLLLAACATGGGPPPGQPESPAASEARAPAAASPATVDEAPPEQPETPAASEARAPAPAPPATVDAAPPAEPAASPSPVAAYLDDPAAITAGRRMFRAVCTGYCHSTTPGVTKDAPNLFDCDSDHGDTDADLYRVITQGVPDTEMLPFDGKIPEDTIWQVIAYVRSNSMDCG